MLYRRYGPQPFGTHSRIRQSLSTCTLLRLCTVIELGSYQLDKSIRRGTYASGAAGNPVATCGRSLLASTS